MVDSWSRVIGTGLVVTAGVIVLATLVEDFLTVGAGAADDPASFAAAGAALARGFAMLGVAGVALPNAARYASVRATTTITLPGGP